MSIYLLSLENQKLYNLIYDSVKAHKTRVIVPPVSDNLIFSVYSKVLSENPEGLLYKVGCISVINSWKNKTLLLLKNDEKDIGNSLPMIYAERKRIINSIKMASDNYDSILSVYRYFIERYRYSDDNSAIFHQSFSPLLYQKAVCEGFSILFAEIMNMMNIPCGVISGASNRNGKLEPHSWNIVKYNNCYYHLDVTWDICTKKAISYFLDYFMLDDYLIKRDHYWDDKSIPKCIDSSKDYYARKKLICRTEREIVNLLVNNLIRESTKIGFRIISDIDRIKLTDSLINEVIDEAFRISRKSYSKITYQYNETSQTVVIFVDY